MSEFQTVAQTLAVLVSNTETSILQVNAYSKEVNQMLVMAKNVMHGTKQGEYEDFVNQLFISQKKLDHTTKCLTEIVNIANHWIEKHLGTIDPMSIQDKSIYEASDSTDTNMWDDSSENINTSVRNDSLRPTRKTPRDLPFTQYGFSKTSTGMEVYDSPLEVDRYLYSKQGSAYDNFKGTCGLCSCANILRLAGVNIGEKEMIDYAANMQGGIFSPRLCILNPFNPDASGGTTPKQRQQILDYFDISSSIWNVKTDINGRTSIDTINDIAKWISEGRGVIVDVDAGLFYNSPKNYGKGHAVTITSVEKNKYGDITAFYILDSNQGTVKYNAWEIQEMLRTFIGMNVTSQIIR